MRILLLLSFLLANSSHATELSRRRFLQGTAATATTLKLNPIANVLAQPEVDMLLLERARFYQMNLFNFKSHVINYLLGRQPFQLDIARRRGPYTSFQLATTAHDLWIERAAALTPESPRFREGSAEFAIKLAQAERRAGERLKLPSQTLFEEVEVTIQEMLPYKPYPHNRTPLGKHFEDVFFEELKREVPTFYSKADWICRVIRRIEELNFGKPLKGLREVQTIRSLSAPERERIIELNRDRQISADAETLQDTRRKIVTLLRQRACEEVLELAEGESTEPTSASGDEEP
jgi:hypothetical protein